MLKNIFICVYLRSSVDLSFYLRGAVSGRRTNIPCVVRVL